MSRQVQASVRQILAGVALGLSYDLSHAGEQATEIPSPAQESNQKPKAENDQLSEILVTASRREQTLEQVPHSLTVISAEDISHTGVTGIASLANQVPGLSIYDLGARLGGVTTPIIRGINAAGESADRSFRTFEQSPVGTYIGNSQINGYFQLDDIKQIEVLRGPQGTLYGAGALGGALRIMPNAPELGVFSGHLKTSAGDLAHSSGTPYTACAMLNVPIGETPAFRASGKYAYEPGFIDVYGILERSGSPVYGLPVLADPSDPINSPGIFTGKNDWNDQNTFAGRASMLWKPVEKFSAELAFIYSHLSGDGGPVTNSAFPGGPYAVDPRVTFPAGGDYPYFAAVDQPYRRRTSLTSFDLSYDAGFATLSSSTSYYTTTGFTLIDQTYGFAGLSGALGPFQPY